MGKEAVENSTKGFTEALQKCRAGEVARGDGYSLWVHGNILQAEGVPFEDFGTSLDEIDDFLVKDIKGWIDRIRDGSASVVLASWDLGIIGAYFYPSNDEQPAYEGYERVIEKLGVSVEEFNALCHTVDIRAGQEELARCRTEGPSPTFWGMKGNLLTGATTLEEIGATAEEIERYTRVYQEAHPYSNWDHIVQTQVSIAQREASPAEALAQPSPVAPTRRAQDARGEHREIKLRDPGRTIFVNPARVRRQ